MSAMKLTGLVDFRPKVQLQREIGLGTGNDMMTEDNHYKAPDYYKLHKHTKIIK